MHNPVPEADILAWEGIPTPGADTLIAPSGLFTASPMEHPPRLVNPTGALLPDLGDE
jgi:hypothetical protein